MSVTETLIDVFSSFFLYELVLLVGKYLICKYKALSIVRHHHWNSLHAQLHFLTKPWFFSASRLTSVNSALCRSCLLPVFSLVFSLLLATPFFIHNKERKAVIVLFLPKPPLENIGHLKVNSHGKASHTAGPSALPQSMNHPPLFTFLRHPSAALPCQGPWVRKI